MNIEQVVLDNKLNTLFVNSPGATAATVQIWFRAGSALEDKSNEGIAHFLEHMFFKGSPTRPGKILAQEVESYGAEFNAFTSFDYTCYYINTPNNHLSRSVEILMDMVANPMFLEEDFPAERQVVFEEYRRALDNPSQFNFMQIQKTAFDGAYAHPILGREETILNFSRQQLIQFRERFYNTNNALLVVAGDWTNRSSIENVINKYSLPSGSHSQFENFKLQTKPQVQVHDKEIKMCTLSICLPAPDYQSEYAPAQDLAINCLAHGETSRLYQALASQSSLCNGVAGSSMYFAHEGMHMMKMVFPLENLKKVKDVFIKQLTLAFTEGFHGEELRKIKNQYIASKVYERESIESFAFSLGHGFAQNGNVLCEEEFIEKIRAASLTDVNHALKTIFSSVAHFILQVPKGSSLTNAEKELSQWQKDLKKIFSASQINKKEEKTITSQFDPAVKVVNIKPGIQFLYRQNKMTPTFVLHAYIKGGQTFENPKTAGIHQLLARSFGYGYQGMPYEKLKRDLELHSAYVSGFSGKNAYGMTMHGQSIDLNKLFQHFFGTLISPEFPNKFVEHEKKIALRALENQKEDPVKQAFKTFYGLVFAKHPYSMELSGAIPNVKTFTHKKIKDLHLKNLKSREIVLTYCGDKDFEDIYPLVTEFCKQLPSRKPAGFPKHQLKGERGKNVFVEMPREQTQIVIGAPAYSIKKKEDIYLKMISAHLSGMGSELFTEVRDRQGLCYSVSPIHISALEAGCWAIYIGAGNDKVEKAINAIYEILNRLSEIGISEDEFERIKTMIDGQTRLNLQTNEDFAQFYSIPILQGLGLDFSHLNGKNISETKYEDFQRFLKVFFKQKWNIIKVGKKS